jgi:hypothetical protein
MKRRNAVLSLLAGLAIIGLIQPLTAAAQAQQKAMTNEQYQSAPKLETVTQKVTGNFAETRIEYTSFKQVDGVDRYYMYAYTGGEGVGLKPLVGDYKNVRAAAKQLMAKLCAGKKAIVESDLFYPTHFTTQFRCN